MNTNQNNMDDVLVSYLIGEATAAERMEVEDWIAANAANRKYFDDFKAIWDESRQLTAQRPADENDAWLRLVKRANEDEAAEQVTSTKGRTIPLRQQTWLRVAAMLVLMVGVGAWLYTRNSAGGEMMVARAGNTPVTSTLPDGSVVVLNKNATLSYPSVFVGSKRNVTLTGEAFFNITPDKSKPFIIDANATSVTVVGTSFNVKTSPDRTEVIVETGIVQVAKNQKSVRLLPNEKATVAGKSGGPEKETNTDELYNYYRTGKFVCNATPLHKLTEVLNEAYNVHIVINDPKLADMPLTTTFSNEPIEDVLKVVSETLNIRAEHQGGDIYLLPVSANTR